MKIKKSLLIKLCLLSLAYLISGVVSSTPEEDEKKIGFQGQGLQEKPAYIPGEIVIQYKSQSPKEEIGTMTSKFGFHAEFANLRQKFVTAKIVGEEKVEEAVARVMQDPNVQFAEPRYLYYKTAAQPNDTDFGKLWGLKNTGQTLTSPSYTTNNPGTAGKDMDVLGGWDVTTSCNSTIVAVLDTGTNYTHQDMAANMWDGSGGCVDHNGNAIGGGCPKHGWDYASNDNDPKDEEGHGSHVSGTLGAVGGNNLGISGVCQSAKIMAVRVLGHAGGDNASIANGIYFAVRNGAKVINMSLGGSSNSSLISDAITFARTYDVLVVVAAGNETTNLASGNSYPCKNTQDNLICIAALDQRYSLANFSNYDTTTTVANRAVDFGAPGVNIQSAYGDSVTYDEGASFYMTGWQRSGLNFGDDWSYRNCYFINNSQIYNLKGLGIPGDCSVVDWNFTAPYNNPTAVTSSMDRRVFKAFTIPSGSTHVSLSQFVISDGERHLGACVDYTTIRYGTSTLDPFGVGNGTFISMYDYNTSSNTTNFCRTGVYSFVGIETTILSNCMNAGTNCTVGYRFLTDSSVNNGGALVSNIYLTAWAPSNTAYSFLNGTSMASPNAAGVAALIRSYNPSFTYAQVIQKLIDGGVSETALTSSTRYGKSVNANNSLKHLNQVTGVSAALQ